MADKKESPKRTRNFSTMVYPDSAPDNWIEILSMQHIPSFISPLHEFDVNPENGELKKAHFHVVIMFDSVKTEKQAREIFDKIDGVGCEFVNSIRGITRYLCHLDNPDKYRYSTQDVISVCGADFDSIIALPSDRYCSIGEMIDFVNLNQIISFSELLNYARLNNYDWFKILCDNGTIVMREYIKSKYWRDSVSK